MGIDQEKLQNNGEQLSRLEHLAQRDVDLAKDLGEGWTAGVALAHMASWDRGAVGLLKLWDGEGRLPDSNYDDELNEALLPEWQAIDPQKALQLAVDAARSVNAAVEALDGDKAEAIMMMATISYLPEGIIVWIILTR